jgi:hypothetical protein
LVWSPLSVPIPIVVTTPEVSVSYPRWRGVSNRATRRRIDAIHWSRQEKLLAFLLGVLVLSAGLVSGWLVSIYRD